MRSIIDYLQGVRYEISRVVWPKRDEVFRLTFVVVLISFIVGLYLGTIDFLFTKILEFVLV